MAEAEHLQWRSDSDERQGELTVKTENRERTREAAERKGRSQRS